MISKEEVPDHWQLLRISDVIEKSVNGGTPKRSKNDYWGGEIPWLSSSEVRGKYTTNDPDEYITQEGLDESSAKIWPKNTVLVAMYGRGTIGRPSITSIRTSGNQAICGLIPDEEVIDTEFLYYWFENIRNKLANKGRGATASQQNLNQSIIVDTKIPVPPLDEQEVIVKSLEERLEDLTIMQESITNLEAKIDEYQDSKFAFLFAGKDTSSEASVPRSVSSIDLPVSWSIQSMDGICQYIQRGKRPEYDEEGETRIINQRCIYWDGLKLENVRRLDASVESKWQDYRYLRKGDVLLNSTGQGTLGRAQIFDINDNKNYVVDGHVTVLRPGDSVDPEYLFYFLQSQFGQNQIEEYTRGATGQTELYKKHVKNIDIILPPLDYQREIVGEIRSARSDIIGTKNHIDSVEVLFNDYENSVLDHAFRGQLNRPEDVSCLRSNQTQEAESSQAQLSQYDE